MSRPPNFLCALLLGGAALLASCARPGGSPRRPDLARPVRPLPTHRLAHHPPPRHPGGHPRR